jgi:hypothetical protein
MNSVQVNNSDLNKLNCVHAHFDKKLNRIIVFTGDQSNIVKKIIIHL